MEIPNSQQRRSYVLSAIILGLSQAMGLAFLGYSLSKSAHWFRYAGKGIQVRGVAEKTIVADKAKLTLTVSLNAETVRAIKEKALWAETKIKQDLKSQGVDPNEWKIESRRTPSFSYMRGEKEENHKDKTYQMNFDMMLSSEKHSIDFLEKISHKAIEIVNEEETVSCSSYIDYECTHFVKERPELLRKAAQDAKEAALVLAKDMNITLGQVESISQGMVEVSGQREKTLRVVLQTSWGTL